MAIQRIRLTIDVLVKTNNGKPLSSPHLVMMANRTGTYARTGAVEGLDVEVLFDETQYNQHAHHHDARYERCRPDLHAAQDELGPIE